MARRRFLKTLASILLGSFILAFGFYNFYYLNNLADGGVLGILLLLKNLFGIDPSIANFVIDFVLLLIGYKFFGKKFFIYSLIASISFSSLYNFFQYLGPIFPKSNSMLLSTILAGISAGVGVGIIVKAGCASGGDDALALIISKVTSLNLGLVYIASDAVILLLSLTYLSLLNVFYSLIAVSISGKVIDFMCYDNINKEFSSSSLNSKH